jgi:hypothetical protein
MLENENKLGDKGQRDDIVKFITLLQTKVVWSCQKNAKPTNDKTNCNSYSGSSKEKRTTQKIGR